MTLPPSRLALIIAGGAGVPVPTVRRWLRGGAVADRWVRRLETAVVQLELSRDELGPRVRLPELPPKGRTI
ncbi:MAG: hypothetical protein IPM35_18220 [Myxococcales bacterium]|nr:hypothetical protein [Myxococcales bacterium]